MSTDDTSSIENQKTVVFQQDRTVKLVDSCVVGQGIVRLDQTEVDQLKERFESIENDVSFFIPASGSGSRMFEELFQFLSTREETPEIAAFFKEFPNLALFRSLPLVVREKFKNLQSIYIAEYLLSDGGLNYSSKPKGLIPFHVFEDQVYNPFQEQVLQAKELIRGNGKIHFTIQQGFEKEVSDSIKDLQLKDLNLSNIEFSYQDSEMDAFCFSEDGNLAMNSQEPLRRPAGHGALLKNLNEVGEDIILIKNIDNVQHRSKATITVDVWKYCVGLLLDFKEALAELVDTFSTSKLQELNAKFQFLSEEEVTACNEERILHYAKRPSRVCGMVINQGAPGGGPFWIEDANGVSKQIVEKVQIRQEDKDVMASSSHFNPVFIALSKTDVRGNLLDLNDFVDHTKNLVVTKPHGTETIMYRELPGLWNGSMSDWNSVFVEIPENVFSPVKSILDLLTPAHRI